MTKPRALIVDDQPYFQDWLIEYFETNGFEVVTAENVEEACQALDQELFKMVIVDLEIPAGAGMRAKVLSSDALVQQFPGMYVAQYARDRGQWDDQVLIYSVHMGEEISQRARQLFCTYLPKGRPDVMKETILAALRRGQRREERRAANRAKKKQEAAKLPPLRTGTAPKSAPPKPKDRNSRVGAPHWPRARKIRKGIRLRRGKPQQ